MYMQPLWRSGGPGESGVPREEHASPDQSAAGVEQGPQQRGQQGGAWGQDLDEGALEDLVPIEGEVLCSAEDSGGSRG